MDFLLVFLMSMDAFLACFTLGTQRISITFCARMVIALIGTGCLFVSLICSNLLSQILPQQLFHFISCFALLVIALCCLLEAMCKQISSSLCKRKKHMSFHLHGLYIMLQICSDSAQADTDHSGSLSPSEACMLALPLSLDSLFTGLAIRTEQELTLLLFSFITGFCATFIGQRLGKKFVCAHGERASICSGFALLLIAGAKLLYG